MANQAVTPDKQPSFTLIITVLVIILMVLLSLLAQRGENPLFVQVLVGVTLVSGFGYGEVERVRGMSPQLREGEALLSSANARWVEGLVPVDGLLTLTSQRLVFSPLWPGPVIEIQCNRPMRVQAMDCAHLWIGAQPQVGHQPEEYVFELQNPRQWQQHIQGCWQQHIQSCWQHHLHRG